MKAGDRLEIKKRRIGEPRFELSLRPERGEVTGQRPDQISDISDLSPGERYVFSYNRRGRRTPAESCTKTEIGARRLWFMKYW